MKKFIYILIMVALVVIVSVATTPEASNIAAKEII